MLRVTKRVALVAAIPMLLLELNMDIDGPAWQTTWNWSNNAVA
jgi:hypothetical protein